MALFASKVSDMRNTCGPSLGTQRWRLDHGLREKGVYAAESWHALCRFFVPRRRARLCVRDEAAGMDQVSRPDGAASVGRPC